MRVMNVVRWVAVSILILVLAAPAAAVYLGGRTIVEVEGESMKPTYEVGDVVIIRPAIPSDLIAGTVVTAISPEKTLYTHRIESVDSTGRMQLKGDGNVASDPGTVKASQIEGVVIHHLDQPWAGLLIQLQQWPLRICMLVVIIGFALMPLGSSHGGRARSRSRAPGRDRRRRRAPGPRRTPSAPAAPSRDESWPIPPSPQVVKAALEQFSRGDSVHPPLLSIVPDIPPPVSLTAGAPITASAVDGWESEQFVPRPASDHENGVARRGRHRGPIVEEQLPEGFTLDRDVADDVDASDDIRNLPAGIPFELQDLSEGYAVSTLTGADGRPVIQILISVGQIADGVGNLFRATRRRAS